MFISSNEKQSMLLRIETLEDRVNTLARSLNALHDVKSMASDTSGLRPSKNPVTEKVRTKRNAYARKYYARKRAEKAAEKVNSTKTK